MEFFKIRIFLFICMTLIKFTLEQDLNFNNTILNNFADGIKKFLNNTDDEPKTDIQKILDSIIQFTNNENKPKQIVSIIVNDISKKFDQIIPNIKDSTNIKSPQKLEKFKDNLLDLKKSFSIKKINELKKNIDEFLNDNSDFLKIEESSEKKILDNFKVFSSFLETISSDLKKLNLENLDGINLIDSLIKPIKSSDLPRDCNKECKCCKEGLCVEEEICKNNSKAWEKPEEKFDFGFISSTPFLFFLAFLILIFILFLIRKKYFGNNGEGYVRQNNTHDVSNTNIELR